MITSATTILGSLSSALSRRDGRLSAEPKRSSVAKVKET